MDSAEAEWESLLFLKLIPHLLLFLLFSVSGIVVDRAIFRDVVHPFHSDNINQFLVCSFRRHLSCILPKRLVSVRD